MIICYSFPPNPGVGGRRWAKFAKFLAKGNNKLSVVAQLNKENKTSEWLKDVESENIEKLYLDQFYPKAYFTSPSSILQKVLYRLWLVFFYTFSKGSLYDKSFFWDRVIKSKIKKLIIEKNIRNVIDLKLTKTLLKGKMEIKLNARDILAQPYIFYQDINKNGKLDKKSEKINNDSLTRTKDTDNVMINTTVGAAYSLSLSFKF